MKWKAALFTLALAVLLGAPLDQARAGQWEIDQDHTGIYFDVRHTFVTVRGLFDDFSGTILFDPENLAAARFDFTVNVASINTNITRRDDHLRSADFFEARTYPRMTFTTKSVHHVQGDEYALEGDLAIKDVTKRITVPLRYFGMQENPLKRGQTVAGFEIDFMLDRLEYNVGSGRFYEMGVIGREVRVLIALEVLKDS
ncbi:YceI family protein [Desulfobulbus alkaliphilus]|uniref:YceI family protein n=1 Tax=Desulfobulbus alkaliphilus TaxID=869814 RepID=UPI00196625F7|nr:YceI family protein [Desulfobulbus alkaliphilus]MBM9535800.1 polyisoprenoid-binding protein [Desulfobulbus alkaliphilus]